MAVTLPLLAAFHGLILVCIGMSLVNISFAFMLNPASAELGNVVDRSGMSCYSAVYAVYNICYSIGMLGTALLATAAARLLHFWGVLLCVSAIILLILSFGGCAIMSGCAKIRHDRGSYFGPRPAPIANVLTGSTASLRATRQEDRVDVGVIPSQ